MRRVTSAKKMIELYREQFGEDANFEIEDYSVIDEFAVKEGYDYSDEDGGFNQDIDR